MYLIQLPRLGQTMQRGIVTTWSVKTGQEFAIGDILYELETDKMNLEVEAKRPGRVLRLLLSEGEEVPIGTHLAVMAELAETPSAEDVDAFIAANAGPAARAEAGQVLQRNGEGAGGAAGRGTTAEVAPPSSGKISAMPRARKRAQELGVDLTEVAARSGERTVTVADVEAYATSATNATVSPAGAADVSPVRERRALTGVRKAMAANMVASWSTVPHFTQTILTDSSALLAERARLKASGQAVSFTELLVDRLARAAHAVPEINAHLRDDEHVLFENVNVGVAVSTERGLVVPVVEDAGRLGVVGISTALREVVERARAGTLGADEVAGATITFSTLGASPVESGTSMLTPPQVAIVFAGNVEERAVVVDGQIVARPSMYLSLTYDHRIIDGATGALFATCLKELVEAAS